MSAILNLWKACVLALTTKKREQRSPCYHGIARHDADWRM